ncbi:ATP-grasp domain-containing protein [Pectobacterium carotovorum]|uniref:ATP-grasp domain-containing protein n=1 Tax=Pectobacterium carotovorum TaxID=554 RepID=A0A419ARY3_PECCA|nr:ATP-grasp domain-containing protein [Pectobacterium carotovorum]RJL48228.1 ATP-grasp domain-containing protein [Pectobacterium carotovorum]
MSKDKAVILAGGVFSFKYPQWISSLKKRGFKILSLDDDNQNTTRLIDSYGGITNSFCADISEFHAASPYDLPSILHIVQQWNEKYTISAAISMIEDFVTPIAYICERYSLPGSGIKAALICRDKLLQRHFLPEVSPAFTSSSKPKLQNEVPVAYPFVIKPTGRSGSSGVHLIRSNDDLSAVLEQYQDDECLLLESLIQGPEYSVESAIVDGKVIVTNITEKTTNCQNSDNFVEMSHTVPALSLSEQMQVSLRETNQWIIERLSFLSGITHAEFKIDQHNRIWLMEIAARGPGDMILYLFQLATGASFEDMAVSISLNENFSSDITYQRYARQVFISPEFGTLSDVKVENSEQQVLFLRDNQWRSVLSAPFFSSEKNTLVEVVIDKPRGMEMTPEVSDSKSRLGYFITVSDDENDLDLFSNQVAESIKIISTKAVV